MTADLTHTLDALASHEDFGLTPHLPAYYAAVLWFAGLGVGGCLNAILERGGGEE